MGDPFDDPFDFDPLTYGLTLMIYPCNDKKCV